MVTPRITVPWPTTAHEWEMYAVCSQIRSDAQRQAARMMRAETWRDLRIDITAAVLAVLAVTILVGTRMLTAAL